MKIDSEAKARICRLYFNEKLSVNMISKQEGFHHKTIHAVINRELGPPITTRKKNDIPTFLLVHKNFIEDLFKKFPNISAPRLQDHLNVQGISCSLTSAKRVLKIKRGSKKNGPVYVVRTFLPGLEAQVDWGELKVNLGGEIKKVYIFLMVLSYSRSIFAYATLNMKFETFTACHSMAFKEFNGVPRKILYDNLKSVVTERFGDIIRFSKNFYDYSSHYLFEPIACHVRCPQEKGIVERNVSYIKNNFFNAREFNSLEDVNLQLHHWIQNRKSHNHPTDRKQTILSCFQQEDLLPLPLKALFPKRYETVKVGKQPYVNFEANRYSIPFKYAFNSLLLHVGMNDLEIYHENELVALHVRSFEKDKIIEDKEHIDELCKYRKKSTSATYQRTYFIRLIPQTEKIFKDLAKNDSPIKPALKRIEHLIQRYGISKVEEAFKQAEKEKHVFLDAVEMILSKENYDTKKDIIIDNLSYDLKSIKTKHHNLSIYKGISK